METAKTKIRLEDYQLRNVKDAIAAWRRDARWILGMIVHVPVEVETSLEFFQSHYRTQSTFFQLDVDLRYGEIAFEKVEPKP